MRTYPINPPEEIPSYVTSSVQAQCDQALANAFGNTSKMVRNIKDQKISEELYGLYRCVAGDISRTDPWVSWGRRTVSQAWRDAETLAHFRESLVREDFSHVTSGHPVSLSAYHVYRRDNSSPSGCVLIASAGKDLPGIAEVMKERRTCAGGERGEMASRAMMRG